MAVTCRDVQVMMNFVVMFQMLEKAKLTSLVLLQILPGEAVPSNQKGRQPLVAGRLAGAWQQHRALPAMPAALVQVTKPRYLLPRSF